MSKVNFISVIAGLAVFCSVALWVGYMTIAEVRCLLSGGLGVLFGITWMLHKDAKERVK